MRTISFDPSNFWSHSTHWRKSAAQQAVHRPDQSTDTIAELEFSQTMRSPSFPAGWFVLPSAVAGCLLLLSLLH
jgi:hypothetical protein